MIGRSAYFLAWSILTALHSDINQTAGLGDTLSMWENRCMHATVCLLCAGQLGSIGHAAKLGSVQRSILVGQIWLNGCERVKDWSDFYLLYSIIYRPLSYLLFAGQLHSADVWPLQILCPACKWTTIETRSQMLRCFWKFTLWFRWRYTFNR